MCNKHDTKAFIPLRNKIVLPDADCPLNEDGIPCCPHDKDLPMRREGSKSHLRCGIPTMKFVCPKIKWMKVDGSWILGEWEDGNSVPAASRPEDIHPRDGGIVTLLALDMGYSFLFTKN